MGYSLKQIYLHLRKAAPLMICVGVIFPWAVSPFGLQSCGGNTGSFVPESRSTLRQWLPLEVKLDAAANHQEDPSGLDGLRGVEIFYFDPLIIIFLWTGFLLVAVCGGDVFIRVVLRRFILGLIWIYLTLIFPPIFIFGVPLCSELWLQPGILLVFFGYLALTLAGLGNFFSWAIERIKGSRQIRN